jgi:hypothetical protein
MLCNGEREEDPGSEGIGLDALLKLAVLYAERYFPKI